MNIQTPRVQTFCCPCCGGNMGEAPPIKVVRDGLTQPMQIKMLDIFASRPGHKFRREFILDQMYADDANGGPDDIENSFRVNLHNLRKSISRFGWHIQCVGGRGRGHYGGGFYRLVPVGAVI